MPKLKKVSKTWRLIATNGRDLHMGTFVEAICEHGVGHHKGIHGCDGCCANWPSYVSDQVTVEVTQTELDILTEEVLSGVYGTKNRAKLLLRLENIKNENN